MIVLNWNGWEDTLACLRALAALEEVREVWLADNGSSEDRSDEACVVWPGLRVLRWNENFGFAGGCNRALRLAAAEGYELAYLLNNDCRVAAGFLTATVRAMAAADRIAAVGSRIVYDAPLEGVRFDGAYHRSGVRPLGLSSHVLPVRAVNGAGMLVRLRALEQEGYFDERFFCYHEEVDWCRRVAERGWVLLLAHGSLVWHRGGGSDRQGNRAYYKSRNRFLRLEHLRGRARLTRGLSCLYKGIVAAREAQRAGRSDDWLAVAGGLHDGLRRRFGPRQPAGGGGLLVTRLLLHGACGALRVHDAWRRIRPALARTSAGRSAPAAGEPAGPKTRI